MAVGVGRAVAQRALTPGARSGRTRLLGADTDLQPIGGFAARPRFAARGCAVAQRSGQQMAVNGTPARSGGADPSFGKLNALGLVDVERPDEHPALGKVQDLTADAAVPNTRTPRGPQYCREVVAWVVNVDRCRAHRRVCSDDRSVRARRPQADHHPRLGHDTLSFQASPPRWGQSAIVRCATLRVIVSSPHRARRDAARSVPTLPAVLVFASNVIAAASAARVLVRQRPVRSRIAGEGCRATPG